ncbi:MAG TPA: hypothetical protein PKD64_00660 [Pirellulaceae bacterium]|nr:hypothetical protein [Pirellulaceae bacterium]HMO90681.1 hypothetical protein [Pirellulaceae bacterium]HMP67740.1 hypothetical protein [Pirellulaceae bacterium]
MLSQNQLEQGRYRRGCRAAHRADSAGQSPRRRIASRSLNRQGMTLILVVSMIVLFLLLATSFAVLAQNYFTASKTRMTQLRVRGDNEKVLLDRALYDLLRGPGFNNFSSPLRGHSILGDQYGYFGFTSVVGGPVGGYITPRVLDGATTDLGLFELELIEPAFSIHNETGVPDYSLVAIPGFYNGTILTFVSGPVKGTSCRIVSYYVYVNPGPPEVTVKRFVILPEWSERPANIPVSALIGSEVVVNGRPFGGAGAGGFAGGNPTINQPALDNEALFPNRIGQDLPNLLSYLSSGANEPWDAIDFQNMFLAGDGNRFASFDRRSLYEFGADPRRNFRAFGVPTDGYQVDNDGDGIPDSIWMDIGLPIQSDIRGRYYKPLVAYRVVDMDGRLNLNAQGNSFDAERANGVVYDTAREANSAAVFGGVANELLPTGLGVGPAEISLAPVFDPFFFEYRNVLYGELISNSPGRYTASTDPIPGGAPGIAGVPNNRSERLMYNKYIGYPRQWADDIPETIIDLSGRFGYAYLQADLDNYNLPTGLPTIDGFSTLANELVDSAYDVEFGRTKTSMVGIGIADQADQLFSPRELERILRLFDVDANFLPSRLARLAPNTLSNATKRNSITTESWEVPTPPAHLADRLLGHILQANGLTIPAFDALPAVQKNVIYRQIGFLLSPDLMKGQRFDINRPFGNGIDDRGNGVIDDYYHPGTGIDEANTIEEFNTLLANPAGQPVNSVVALDLDNNGTPGQGGGGGSPYANNEAFLARQIYARHLYVMILLVTEPKPVLGGPAYFSNAGAAAYWFDYDGSGTTDVDDIIAYRSDVAQWVANIIDYRDFDVISTPFEFDLNPFVDVDGDGNFWDVDGLLTTNEGVHRRVVWGMERPELLLTESFALHDRRTEDLDDDENGPNNSTANGDPDFDNRLRPVAATFIEVYNPQVRQHQTVEIYGGTPSVLLGQTTPGGSPVWRIAVVKGENPYVREIPVPNAFDAMTDDRNRLPHSYNANVNLQASDIDRYVYFVDPGAALPPLAAGQLAYFPNFVPAGLLPGQYAVIGSQGNASPAAGQFTTTFGRIMTAIEPVDAATIEDTQHITLIPGSNQIRIRRLQADGSLATTVRDNVRVIPVGDAIDASGTPQVRSFAISDPIAGYPALGPTGNPTAAVGDGVAYSPAYDTPLDQRNVDNTDPKAVYQAEVVATDGTTATFAVLHLQRLANPLADYDPITNPYLTCDRIGTDLTTFNGVTNPSGAAASLNYAFQTLERGNNESVASRQRLLWREAQNQIQADIPPAGLPIASDHYFSRPLVDSLGEVNSFYRNNPSFVMTPFAWLKFANRPFASHAELTSVPRFSNSFVLNQFSARTRPDLVPGVPDPYLNPNDGFRHLPNFFDSTQSPLNRSADLVRVLDYLEVPSRFLGTETYLNPLQALGANLTPDYINFGPYAFNPPFNALSRFRVPGKVNINTIFSEDVWNATVGRGFASVFTYANMDLSRRNSAKSPAPAAIPAEHANPFRPGEAANYMPLAELVPDLPVDATLHRRQNAMATEGLFDIAEAATGFHNNSVRSHFFREHARQRLGGLVTTRSSVFAIWITVGYFEINPNNGALRTLSGVPANMPGAIGLELGSDEGAIRRNRAFYLVDRSIPVAFQPGRNHNVDRMILIESIIE